MVGVGELWGQAIVGADWWVSVMVFVCVFRKMPTGKSNAISSKLSGICKRVFGAPTIYMLRAVEVNEELTD